MPRSARAARPLEGTVLDEVLGEVERLANAHADPMVTSSRDVACVQQLTRADLGLSTRARGSDDDPGAASQASDERAVPGGSAKRCPLAPAVNSSEPMEAAWPMHSVVTDGLMNCIVS